MLNVLRDESRDEGETQQITEEAYREQCEDFLACWDGKGNPLGYWDSRLTEPRGGYSIFVSSSGECVNTWQTTWWNVSNCNDDERPRLPSHPFDRFGDGNVSYRERHDTTDERRRVELLNGIEELKGRLDPAD